MVLDQAKPVARDTELLKAARETLVLQGYLRVDRALCTVLALASVVMATGGNGLVLDRFTAGVNGAVVWVQGQGSVFERGLIDGEVLDLRFGALLCKDAGVSVESLAPSNDKAARFEVACLRLTGAGRIAFQNSAASSPVGLPDAKPPARRAGLFSRAQG